MLHAVIMAGGAGTRFWPASRQHRPKQMLSLVDDEPLLTTTFERVSSLVPAQRIWVVTVEPTAEETRRLLPELCPENLLIEPCARDTAACVGFAAHHLLHRDPDATCIVLPADHVVHPKHRFHEAMNAGYHHILERGGLLTFGVKPTHAHTGYGYLKVGAPASTVDGLAVHHLTSFVEKPDLATAKSYIADPSYLWNSGIFAWRAETLLAEIDRQLPCLAQRLGLIRQALGTRHEATVIAEEYSKLQRVSIDYGVMEGARQCWTIPVDFSWSDVGCWTSLAELLPHDSMGNALRGRVHACAASNNILFSDGPAVVVAGVKELITVATDDVVLVSSIEGAQQLKEIVQELEARGWHDVL